MTRAFGVLAGCMLLVVMLAVGATAAGSDAAVGSCLPTGVSVTGAVPTAARLDAEQAANSRLIVSTVVQRRLPTRAAVIAVATAMQESELRNIPYGDRDSLGLFQQRPSQGWGDALTVMNPVRATNSFLDRLQTVRSWPVLPLTVAAQEVQHSGFPDAYARWEPMATAVVASLLRRPTGGVHKIQDVPDTPNQANALSAGCSDSYGGYSRVPVAACGFTLALPTPRSCANAVRWALGQVDGPAVWSRRCLHFVANAYGYAASGTQNPTAFWATAAERHIGDPAAPAGALVFWDTGDPDGHVGLSAGNGLVISNDIRGPGTIAVVPMGEITRVWHATYLGWAPPAFPNAI